MRISGHHIRYSYPGSETLLFKDLSFSIDRPGFHALFGPSGIGKTSFAKLIIGALPGMQGRIDIANNLHPLLYTYNLERLPGWSSVGRHIQKMMPANQSAIKHELVQTFRLPELMGSRFAQLSLGQQNRVNLLRYLLQAFDLLIMDESLANVDERTREFIILKIKALFPDRIFLYISHNVVEVAKFCDQIMVFRHAGKSPQVIDVQGLDLRDDIPLDQVRLDQTMLEIMNAS